MTVTQSGTTSQKSSMKMYRNVHFACKKCFAPGEFKSDNLIRYGYGESQISEMIALDPKMKKFARHFRTGWPECWVPINDPKRGMGVGTTCPHCGAKRAKPKPLKPLNVFARFF